MGAPFKYAFVLALGLAFGFCIHAPPNLEEIARLAKLDQINVLINSAVVRLKPQAAVFAVDPASAARVAEDLDGSPNGSGRSRDGNHSSPFMGAASMRRLRQERSRGCFSPSRPPRRPLLRSQMRRPSAPKLRVIPFGLPRFRPGPKLRLSPPRAGSATWATKRR